MQAHLSIHQSIHTSIRSIIFDTNVALLIFNTSSPTLLYLLKKHSRLHRIMWNQYYLEIYVCVVCYLWQESNQLLFFRAFQFRMTMEFGTRGGVVEGQASNLTAMKIQTYFWMENSQFMGFRRMSGILRQQTTLLYIIHLMKKVRMPPPWLKKKSCKLLPVSVRIGKKGMKEKFQLVYRSWMLFVTIALSLCLEKGNYIISSEICLHILRFCIIRADFRMFIALTEGFWALGFFGFFALELRCHSS